MLLSKHRSVKLLLACLMAVGFFLPATMNAQAASATVKGVSVSDAGSGMLNVNVKASAPLSYKSSRSSQGREMVLVDVSPATLDTKASKETDVNRGLLEKVVLSQLKSDVVRVSLYVISQPKLNIGSDVTGLSIALSTEAGSADKKAVSKSGKTVAKADGKSAGDKGVKKAEVAVAEKTAAKVPEAKKAEARKVAAVAAPKVAKKAVAKKVAKKATKKAAPEKTVNLELVNADLVYVVKYLAKEMNRNVYVAPGVAGSVTVTLNKVRPEGALALILKMQEAPYEYKLVDNTIIVASREKLDTVADTILNPRRVSGAAKKSTVNQEFFLENAPAAKVVEFLAGQYPDVTFTAHPTMNGFFAKGVVDDIKSIKAAIPGLDQLPPAPAAPRREYLTVNYAGVDELVNHIKALVPDAQLTSDKRLSLIIVDGTDEVISRVEEVKANLDRCVDQVMIDCKVVELTESGSKNLGISWAGNGGGVGVFSTTFGEVLPSLFTNGETFVDGDVSPGYYDEGEPNAGDIGPLGIGSFGRTPFMIQATMNMVIQNSDGKVLASPRVAAMSGESANIHVGDKYPIVFYDPRAGQFQVNYVDIGTKINVKPEVKSDGYIICEIEPTMSTLRELINQQYPRTSEKTVKTKMRIKDGDTVVLGGMIDDQEQHSVTKIPLLGDLPIFGPFFRTVSDTSSRSEVVVMMTTHVMK